MNVTRISILFLLAALLLAPSSASGESFEIDWKTNTHENTTVKVGDTVRWIWADNAMHTVTSEDGTFDSGFEQGMGFIFEFTFLSVGDFDYLCQVHGAGSMSGTVTVEAIPEPPGTLSADGLIESTAGGFKFPDGTVQTTSAAPAAMPLPETGGAGVTRSRFLDRSDGTVYDRLSGLVWLLDAGCAGALAWQAAFTWVDELNSGTYGCDGYLPGAYSDWRMPNIRELMSLASYDDAQRALPFTRVGRVSYWSSTTDRHSGRQRRAWTRDSSNGELVSGPKSGLGGLWPVRSSGAGAGAMLPPAGTGQKHCWDANGQAVSCRHSGQDGELQRGVPWPTPRFESPRDGTIKDLSTGLVWLRDGHCAGRATTWSEALEWVEMLNRAEVSCAGYRSGAFSDWRLPSVHEALSLTSFGGGPNGPLVDYFLNLEESGYWTSTESGFRSYDAWITQPFGGLTTSDKRDTHHIMPVRDDGQ